MTQLKQKTGSELRCKTLRAIKGRMTLGESLEGIMSSYPEATIAVIVETPREGTRDYWIQRGAYFSQAAASKAFNKIEPLTEDALQGIFSGTISQLNSTGIPHPENPGVYFVSPDKKETVYKMLAESLRK
jgi:hypothetical protein